MSYTALPTKNPGDVLTSALWNTYLQGNADSGFMRKIADSTAGGAVASFDFTGIDQTFAALKVVIEARGDAVATLSSVLLRFNNDSGASQYCYAAIKGSGTTATVTDNTLNTSAFVGDIGAASANAGLAGIVTIIIPAYTGTTFLKKFHAQWSAQSSTAAGANSHGMSNGFWNNSGAINRITLLPSAGNFIAGSRATIYGLPA